MYTLEIRPKRQATLPRELLDKLDLEIGDSLKAYVQEGKLVLVPQKKVALDALAELQKIIAESSVSEADIQGAVENERNATQSVR